MTGRVLPILVLLLAVLGTGAAASPEAVPPPALEAQVFTAFTEGNFARAARLIEEYLETAPNDATMRYNLACAYCRMGERDRAASALRRAVEAGFIDFDHMKRDPDLAAIRDHPLFTAILEAADRVAAMGARQTIARWRGTFGSDAYRYEVDESRRLAYAAALDEVSLSEMREMLERQADHLSTTLFGDAPGYFVLIAVPTPKDAHRLFRGDASIGGVYQHAERRLVTRDIGGSLRHEFVHLMHYGHMVRLGQQHPIWIQEGLASLYEDYAPGPDGSIRFLPNERRNIVHRLARAGHLVRWKDLMSMPADRFMATSRVGQMYPQVRSVFLFLADEGQLERWYETYVDRFDDDPVGTLALEKVFGQPLEEIERRWRRWVRLQPKVDAQIADGDGSLGIRANPRGSNDGVVIASVLPRSAAALAGLHRGDVIVSIDGQATRNRKELRTIIGGLRPGDRIVVRVRRDGRYEEVPVTLRPLAGGF